MDRYRKNVFSTRSITRLYLASCGLQMMEPDSNRLRTNEVYSKRTEGAHQNLRGTKPSFRNDFFATSALWRRKFANQICRPISDLMKSTQTVYSYSIGASARLYLTTEHLLALSRYPFTAFDDGVIVTLQQFAIRLISNNWKVTYILKTSIKSMFPFTQKTKYINILSAVLEWIEETARNQAPAQLSLHLTSNVRHLCSRDCDYH